MIVLASHRSAQMELRTTQLGEGAWQYSVVRPTRDAFSSIMAMGGAAVTAVTAPYLSAMAITALASLTVMFWLACRSFRVVEESLTAIEGIGLQLCTRRASGHETAQFIERASVSDIFIAEAVRIDRCFFYLACLLHGDDSTRQPPRLVVPFYHLIPTLNELERICHGAHAVLFRGSQPGRLTS